MTDFKDITSFLLNGKVHLAEKTLNNIVNYKLMENSLANISGYLKSNKKNILKTLEYSDYNNLWTDAVVNKNTDEALSVFTNFVADEVGVNPKLFKTWQLNKEFIDWYNVNIAAKVDLPPVPPSNTFWTKFDPDGLGTEYQDDIHGTSARSNGVTSGHRENEFGKVGDADSVGNVSPEIGDTISKVSGKTDVRNRDIGSDIPLTKDIDANQMYRDKWDQEIGRTHDDREKDQDTIRAARLSKFGSTSMPKKIPSQNGGGRRTKFSTQDETNWASKFNGLKLSNKLPTGVKNPNDLKDWFEKNKQ